jgi:hypothetical protein
MIPFELSDNLNHTWFIDMDGTVVEVNYPPYDNDTLLLGVVELWANIPDNDIIVITTARTSEFKEKTLKILDDNSLRYDHTLFDLAHGERIVINDNKEHGLQCAIAWNVKRNGGYPQ